MSRNRKLIIILFILVIFLFQIPFIINSNSPLSLGNPELASADNFEIISNADHATKWTLLATDSSEGIDFHDNIASGYWDLYGVGNRYMSVGQHLSNNYLLDNYSITTGWVYSGTHWDTGVQTDFPYGITWTGSYFWIVGYDNAIAFRYTAAGVYTGYSFDISYYDNQPMGIAYYDNHLYITGREHNKVYKFTTTRMFKASYSVPQDSWQAGIEWDGSNFWIVGNDLDIVHKYTSTFTYTGTSFNVGGQDNNPTGITWDGTSFFVVGENTDEVYRYNAAGTYTGVHFDVGAQDIYPIGIEWDGTHFWVTGDYNAEVYQYEKEYSISKNYYGGGYAYMQTDTTETVGLRSPTYGSIYSLSAGDYFKINCKPMTSNKIELKLYNNTILQKTLTVIPQDNTDYNTRDIEVSVDEYVEFDRLLFTGTLENTDYFKVFDVKTYKYPPSLLTYWLSGYERRLLSIPDYEYTLKIYDGGILKVEKIITLNSDLLTEIYSPIETIECRLSLFSQENDPLDFSLFHINITRTLNNNTDTYPLLNNIFLADIETIVNISIWDRFDNSIKNDSVVSKPFIDIVIDIYSFKISHKAMVESSITIQTTGSDYIITESLSPDELIEYQLINNNYTVNWINGENDELTIFNIILTSDYLLVLPTTFYDIYFTLSDSNFHQIDITQYTFRLNGTIKEFGLIKNLETDTYNITVHDRFDIELFNEIVYLRDLNEYDISITLFELQIRYLGSRNSNVTITYPTLGTSYDFIMPPDSIRSFYCNNSVYNISWINGENGEFNSYIINLNQDRILTLNSTYYDVFFNLYDTNLHIIDESQYSFYLNSSITDFGLVESLETDTYNITVYDIFNLTLFNQIVYLHGLNEYRINIELYQLQIRHLGILNSNVSIRETTSNNIYNFIMPPDSITSFNFGSSTYNVSWINGENNENNSYLIDLSSDYILTLNTSYYDVYFSLFNYNNERLDDSLFSFYLNNTRKDFGFVSLESEYYNITVFDLLNVSVYNQIVYLKNYQEYNIIINAFELQIRHLGVETSKVNITEITTNNSIEFLIPADTLRMFSLANSTYNITWTNGENNQETSYIVIPSSDVLLTLNSTYYQVYFSIFNYDGLGIMPETVRFYINNERKDLGFNTLKYDTNNLKVLDFFNATLFDQDVYLRGYTEYNIATEIYELIVLNNFTHSIIISVERAGSSAKFIQIIPSQSSISYRFLTNITYKINCYYINGTFVEEKTVFLNRDPMLVSFGWYTAAIPPEPEIDTTLVGGLVFWVVVLVIAIIGLAIGLQYYKNDRDYYKYYA